MDTSSSELGRRIEAVRASIRRAALKSGRAEADVMLLAVTKSHPVETVRAAYAAGLRHFGENRVEEAEEKLTELAQPKLVGVDWHMIGHLQSRKAIQAANLFRWVHSVDRIKIAGKLNEALAGSGQHIESLLEVNLTGEASKSGFDLSRWPNDDGQESALFRAVEALARLQNIGICGLMTIPQWSDDAEAARPVFARLRELRNKLFVTFPELGWKHLSMGMSADFEVAIEEGATIVRLGTILFGARSIT